MESWLGVVGRRRPAGERPRGTLSLPMGFRWKQAGSIRFWYNRLNIQGYHFTATPDACESILQLLVLLREHPAPRQQTLVTEPMTKKILEGYGRANKLADVRSFEKLRLDHDPELSGDFTIKPGEISFSTAGLDMFRESGQATGLCGLLSPIRFGSGGGMDEVVRRPLQTRHRSQVRRCLYNVSRLIPNSRASLARFSPVAALDRNSATCMSFNAGFRPL